MLEEKIFEKIAEEFGTPVFVYEEEKIRNQFQNLKKGILKIQNLFLCPFFNLNDFENFFF